MSSDTFDIKTQYYDKILISTLIRIFTLNLLQLAVQ